MGEAKTITINTIIALGIVLASMVGPTFFEEPKYYCEAESSIMQCDGGLSGGLGSRCYLTKEQDSWDYCSTGWLQITDDLKIQEEEQTSTPSVPQEDTARQKYSCNSEGCTELMKEGQDE